PRQPHLGGRRQHPRQRGGGKAEAPNERPGHAADSACQGAEQQRHRQSQRQRQGAQQQQGPWERHLHELIPARSKDRTGRPPSREVFLFGGQTCYSSASASSCRPDSGMPPSASSSVSRMTQARPCTPWSFTTMLASSSSMTLASPHPISAPVI